MNFLMRLACLIALLASYLLVGYGQAPPVPPPQPPVFDPFDPADLPWPDDPPAPWDSPFDPITDLPEPIDIPFPPEDPFDDPVPEIPLPPDPFDLDDPFPDVPSLFDGDFLGYAVVPPLSFDASPAADTSLAVAQPATNRLTKLMPFPRRIFFPPAYSGKTAPRTARNCNPTTASNLIIPESKSSRVAFLTTCPWNKAATVAVGKMPVSVAGTPDRTLALVANAGDGNTSGSVSVINIASRMVTKTITFPATDVTGAPITPNNIAFLPDGSRAYVSSHGCNPGSFVYIIDMTALSVTGSIPVGCFPASIAVTPDGAQLWVSDHGDNRVEVFDTATNANVVSLNIGLPFGIAFSPLGTVAYIAEASPGDVAEIDALNYRILTRIPVGSLPHAVAVTPSGHYVFVTNALSNSISEISAQTNSVLRTIKLPNNLKHPLGLAFIER